MLRPGSEEPILGVSAPASAGQEPTPEGMLLGADLGHRNKRCHETTDCQAIATADRDGQFCHPPFLRIDGGHLLGQLDIEPRLPEQGEGLAPAFRGLEVAGRQLHGNVARASHQMLLQPGGDIGLPGCQPRAKGAGTFFQRLTETCVCHPTQPCPAPIRWATSLSSSGRIALPRCVTV